jgi:hypothetical protein
MAIVMGPTTEDTLRRQHGHSNDLQCLRQALIHEHAATLALCGIRRPDSDNLEEG